MLRTKRKNVKLLAVIAAAVVTAVMAVPTVASAALPRPDHIVVAIHENHGYSQVVGTSAAPYINSLAAGGANFTNYHGVTHPSQGNYVAMFSGSTQGVTNDNCPQSFVGKDNLARQLLDVNLTFKLFAETMPSVGYTGCSAGSTPGDYQRKHNPVPNFNNVPSNLSVPFTGLPSDFSTLPTVSWVVPNECNDMHNCSVGTGDSWTQSKLSAYATWAKTHNSLLVVTFDENDCFILCNIFDSTSNKIATIIYGDHVKTGNYSTLLNHYSLLRTIEDMYGLRKSGSAATATAITNAWL